MSVDRVAPDLTAIRARCEKATPGPWEAKTWGHWMDGGGWGHVLRDGGRYIVAGSPCRAADVEFIAHCREDIPALLDECERLNTALLQIQGDSCESFTSGLGSCYRWGRMDNARFGADRPCMPCIAHRALSVRAVLATEASQ